MNDLDQLNSIFHFHRLFGKQVTFVEALESKQFIRNRNGQLNPLLINIQYGGSITYSVPTTFECISNPFYLLMYIEKGDILIKSTENYQFSSNELVIISPNTNFRFDTKSTPCYFHLYLLEGQSLPLYTDGIRHASFKGKHISNQFQYLQHLLFQHSNDVSFLINKTLTDILTDCVLLQNNNQQIEASVKVPKYISEMKRIIDSEYSTVLTLELLEQRLLISKYRLCREFKKHYGQSPLQYLNNVRILEAKLLLEQTDITIHAIGFGVGIPNTSHFIKLFKRETNLTPAEYRKKKELLA